MKKSPKKSELKQAWDDIGDFQANFGKDIVPMQRLAMFFGLFIMLGLGLTLIIYSQVKKTNGREETHMMLFSGIIIIIFAVMGFTISYVWTTYAKKNRTIAQINALGTEVDILKGIFN